MTTSLYSFMLSMTLGPSAPGSPQVGTTKKLIGEAENNCKNLNLGQQHLNLQAELLTAAILDAAKKTIPRGRRRLHSRLELLNTMNEAREKMEQCPSDKNTAEHNKAQAEFTRQKLHQTRSAWYEKTSFLNMEKDRQTVEAHQTAE